MTNKTERRVILRTDEIQGIRAGRKTQFRRVMDPQPELLPPLDGGNHDGDWMWSPGMRNPLHNVKDKEAMHQLCPFGKPGDRLWVAETWCHEADNERDAKAAHEDIMSPSLVRYFSTEPYAESLEWLDARTMPRWACRLVIEVVEVRPERLQEISVQDIGREGLDLGAPDDRCVFSSDECRQFVREYETLWNTYNPDHPLGSNPWVWAVTFELVE